MPDNTSVRWPFWLSFVLWSVFIGYGLLSSSNDLPRFPWLQFEGADKLIHSVLFGIDGFLLALATSVWGYKKAILTVVAWSFAFGGGLEVIQHFFVADRTGDVFDLMADMVGGVLGAITITVISRKFQV